MKSFVSAKIAKNLKTDDWSCRFQDFLFWDESFNKK